MPITNITITQDNFINGSNLLPVDNELFFLFDVTFTGDVPNEIGISLYENGIELIRQRAIPWEEITLGSSRRFIYRADSAIRSFYDNSSIDDFDQAVDTLVPASDSVKKITLRAFPVDNESLITELSFVAVRGCAQIGDYPNKQSVYDNSEMTYYVGKNEPVYTYYYSKTGGTTIEVNGVERIELSELTLYRYKSLHASSTQVTFTENATNPKVKRIEVIGNGCSDDRLVKYLDGNGQYRFFPFNSYYEISEAGEAIGEINKLYSSIRNAQAPNYNIGYRNKRQWLLTAEMVSNEQLEVLADINASPRVYLYTGDGLTDEISDWTLVTMVNNVAVRPSKRLFSEVSLQIEVPERNSIKMI